MSVETKVLNERFTNLSDIESVIELCRENEDELVNVSKVLNALLQKYNLTISEFTAKCGFSRSNRNLKGWFDGSSEPRGRAQYLKIAIGLGMTLQETNRFLVRVGECSVLYPKTIEDAAYIHLITSGKPFDEHNEIKLQMEETLDNCVIEEISADLPGEYISQRKEIADLMTCAKKAGNSDALSKTRTSLTALNKQHKKAIDKAKHKLRRKLIENSDEICSTEIMYDELINLASCDMFSYVQKYWKEYVTRNWRLLEYIDEIVERYSYEDFDGKMVDSISKIAFPLVDEVISCKAKISMENAMSDLRNYGKTPSRAELITIGFILDQDVDGINNILDIAGMEPLCAKRGVEAALSFAITKQSRAGYVTAKDVHKTMAEFSKYYENDTLPRLLDMLNAEDE